MPMIRVEILKTKRKKKNEDEEKDMIQGVL